MRGNTYAQFETSVRGVGLKPGDLITLTYLKEGYLRQPFRITAVSPGVNYRTVAITAQIHNDEWYSDLAGDSNPGTRRQPGYELGLPRPLLGSILDEEGESQFEIQESSDEGAGGQTNTWLKAGFVTPRQPAPGNSGIPLFSLSPVVSDSGGTLGGDRTYYYAVSALGADGMESPLSFLVRATIPFSTGSNSVRINGLSFAPGTTGFHVYRGRDPLRLFRIATAQPVAAFFVDTGLPNQLETPPDEHYDHANFYWRLELQPEAPATVHSGSTIGNETLEMPVNEYRGMVARITHGAGKGQERPVVANTAGVLTVAPAWVTEPDGSSIFVVAEAGWHFGAMGRTSPVGFEVPSRPGTTVHVSGRAANVSDKECAYELSPLTRWLIGGEGGTPLDTAPPGKPVFGLHPTGQGTVEVVGVGFEELTNTRSIAAGTLALNYWDELDGVSQVQLSQVLHAAESSLYLSAAGSAVAGSLIQLEAEVLRVTEVLDGGLQYTVDRGVQSSTAAEHDQGTPVEHLKSKVYVLPFSRDFFGSPASGSYSFAVFLPDVRIASAELIVTNSRGNSEPSPVCLTASTDFGLRTLAGGQLSIQVEGYLAIHSDVAPPLVIEETHCARDISAVVREAPLGAPIELRLRQNGDEYCRLLIPAGALISNVVTGLGLPPLMAGSQINLDTLSVPQGGSGTPGRDLTVTIRL